MNSIENDHILPFGKFSFSVGHFLNDLCASIWFSYALVFYHRIGQFSNSEAGFLLLIGQVADAFSTTFVGFASDQSKRRSCAQRKSWHRLGVFCVLISFPFCFQLPISSSIEKNLLFSYYTFFIVVFQFGWACSQIGHLSMLNELTSNESERVALNAYRHAWSIVANIFVYAVTWITLNANQTDQHKNINEETFRILIYAITIAGSITSLIFQFGSKESTTNSKTTKILYDSNRTWRDFIFDKQFYLVSSIWMLTRVVSNISQVYLPLYIMDATEATEVDRRLVAIGPLVIYIVGFLTSFPMRAVNDYLGRKLTMTVGLIFILISSGCFWSLFIIKDQFNISIQSAIIFNSILLGVGITTTQITSSAFTSDLIGQHTGAAAFVYGIMSFSDKVANGLAIVIIQQYNPCSFSPECCRNFYRNILSLVPGMISLVTLFILREISSAQFKTRLLPCPSKFSLIKYCRIIKRYLKNSLLRITRILR